VAALEVVIVVLARVAGTWVALMEAVLAGDALGKVEVRLATAAREEPKAVAADTEARLVGALVDSSEGVGMEAEELEVALGEGGLVVGALQAAVAMALSR
jgi:hypothetical protein